MITLFIFLIFLCWGSFLNVVAYRITYDRPFLTRRSYCPFCEKTIAWYDNIPLLSWVLLGGKCRSCKKPISYLYPLVELITGVVLTALFFELFVGSFDIFFWKPFIAYFIYFSALIVATRTDLQEMVIPQLFSIWLVPLGLMASYFGVSQTTLIGSIAGTIIGYGILWVIGFVFKHLAKREGIGVGDMELLAMIGSFSGPLGVWFALLVGSITGLVFGGLFYIVKKKDHRAPMPFGPFLALGATLYFFFQSFLLNLLL